MTRLARIALMAVLAALCCAMQATAAPSTARLDPARVFNPQAESLFAGLTPPGSLSLVSASIFGEQVAFDRLFSISPGTHQTMTGAGIAAVNFNIPQVRSTFEPVRTLAYEPTSSLNQAPVEIASPQSSYADAPVLSTAPPQLPSVAAPRVNFGSYSPFAPAVNALTEGAAVPVRLGSVHFETAFHAMQVCGTADESAACSSVSEAQRTAQQQFTAGTDFNVRAGNRSVNVQFAGGIAHVNNQNAAVFPYVPLDSDAQAGLTYAGLADVVEHQVGAGVAVPINQHLSVGLQFDRAHYQGDFGSAVLPGYEAMRDTYLGNVTYQMAGSSAVTLSARQYRYQDLLAPNFNIVQTRADLDFTVKF
jgi:hypothetical protein